LTGARSVEFPPVNGLAVSVKLAPDMLNLT
jgi:hypothetical protein